MVPMVAYPMAETPTSGSPKLESGISVVVPVYNSEVSLPLLVERLGDVLPQLAERYEVVLINDGSRDGSQRRIEELAAGRPWVRWVELRRNFGQHNAVLCGLRAARYEITVTIDDDLQHPPAEIRVLLDALGPEIDVVYGAPEEEAHGLWRDLASQLIKWALQASMGVEVARNVSAFRALRTEMREGFARFDGSYVHLDAMLTWVTNRFAAVRVKHETRRFGRSNYAFRDLVRVAIELATGFSERPLRLATIFGLAFAGFGLVLLTYLLVRYFVFGGILPGFTFLASSIAIFSGAQLLALGVIGEYLARVHSRSMRRPPYFVRRRAPGPGPEK